MSQVDQRIAEVENTRRIVRNTSRLLRTATFSGNEAANVAESIKFCDFIADTASAELELLKKEKREEKKAKADEPAPAAPDTSDAPKAEMPAEAPATEPAVANG